MEPGLRTYFDQVLDQVLRDMPEQVHRLLNEVTLYVEDHPSPRVMRQLGVTRRHQLCGLYTGIPLDHRSIEHSGILSDAVHIFRDGILAMASTRRGDVDDDELRRQIRITVLHELAHHFGITERELHQLGYG